ncbi:MAG: hypothetical protein D6685_15335 [Bacteroidetes bacterium]|nr:MAG: hypothetical protein D6685_15335 [Bacteroidota bacterium]
MVMSGATSMLVRRTSQRLFRFPPGDPVVEQIFLYCLGYAAAETGVQVHGWILLSNHYHVVVTDTRGTGPEFYQKLNQNIAALIKRHFGLPEEIWNTSQTSVTDLSDKEHPSEEAVLERLQYTLGNAQISGLVRRWWQWEGALSKPEDMGQRVVRVRRPACASRRTTLPEAVELRVTVPPVLAHWERSELIAALRELLRSLPEPERPLGMKRVHEQGIWDRPNTPPKKRSRGERVAGDPARRQAKLAVLRAFHADYERSMERHRAGEPCVFPRGTWKMVRLFNVPVEGGADPPAEAA